MRATVVRKMKYNLRREDNWLVPRSGDIDSEVKDREEINFVDSWDCTSILIFYIYFLVLFLAFCWLGFDREFPVCLILFTDRIMLETCRQSESPSWMRHATPLLLPFPS